VKESYAEIPSFLRALKKKNPESRVCLQMDSQGRFYCSFLSYPFLIFSGNDYENALLPVFQNGCWPYETGSRLQWCIDSTDLKSWQLTEHSTSISTGPKRRYK
jgi:hypothetical protein